MRRSQRLGSGLALIVLACAGAAWLLAPVDDERGNTSASRRPTDANSQSSATGSDERGSVPAAVSKIDLSPFSANESSAAAESQSGHPNPKRVLEGRVLDSHGNGVVGANMLLAVHGRIHEVSSLQDGRYAFRELPPYWSLGGEVGQSGSASLTKARLKIAARGFAVSLFQVFNAEDASGVTKQNFVLESGGMLLGAVLDIDSETGLEGAEVFALLEVETINDQATFEQALSGEHVLRTTAGSNGEFSIGPISASSQSSLCVVARAAQHQAAFIRLGNRGIRTNFRFSHANSLELICPRTASVEGRVVDATGKGVAGFRVLASNSELRARRRSEIRLPNSADRSVPSSLFLQAGTTDTEGRYGIDVAALGSGPCNISVRAEQEELAHLPNVVGVVRASETTRLPDLVVPMLARIEVVVEDTSGGRIANARISIDVQTPNRGTRHSRTPEIKTDEFGTALLTVYESEFKASELYRLTVSAKGFRRSIYDDVALSSSQTATIRAVLRRDRGISGLVLLGDKPATDAFLVKVAPAGNANTKEFLERKGFDSLTNVPWLADTITTGGRFEVNDLPKGPYDVFALNAFRNEGAAIALFQTGVTEGTEDLTFRSDLTPPVKSEISSRQISGCVFDAASMLPVPDCDIQLSLASRPDSSNLAITNQADGSFSFSNISEGHYRIMVDCAGYQRLKQIVEASSSANPVPLQLLLTPLPVIRGRVVAFPGFNLHGAALFIYGETMSLLAKHRLDSQGNFEVSTLPAGTRYHVVVQEAGGHIERSATTATFAEFEVPADPSSPSSHRTVNVVPSGVLSFKAQGSTSPDESGDQIIESESRHFQNVAIKANGFATTQYVFDGMRIVLPEATLSFPFRDRVSILPFTITEVDMPTPQPSGR